VRVGVCEGERESGEEVLENRMQRELEALKLRCLITVLVVVLMSASDFGGKAATQQSFQLV